MSEKQATTAEQDVLEFGRRWAAAEVAKDLGTLDAMAHPQLRLVGPLGFILDRNGWLYRYRSGDLDTTELTWDEVEVRIFGDTAVTIGVQHQKVTFRGRPNDGDFRISHVLVRDPQARFGWLIVSIQLSTMAPAPPGAPPGAPTGPPTGAGR
ncbi:MAG TPA: nuclear transport factor 2 family protein [Microlunatus sp.]